MPRQLRRDLKLPLLIILLCCAVSPAVPQARERDSRQEFTRRLVAAAVERTHHSVRYVSEYVRIPYPGGDVPADTGVCTDEIIRSYRAVGVDLQKEVHEDMAQHFPEYPHRWGRTHADSNIDHRRVPNLRTWLARQNAELPIPRDVSSWQPGDIFTSIIARTATHIGFISDRQGADRPLIIHNIGEGAREEDALLDWRITGRYRWAI